MKRIVASALRTTMMTTRTTIILVSSSCVLSRPEPDASIPNRLEFRYRFRGICLALRLAQNSLSTLSVSEPTTEANQPMIPGGRMNPKQMQAMMKRMGIKQEELYDVEEVVIKTKTEEIVFRDATVSAVTVQGQKTYQVVG